MDSDIKVAKEDRPKTMQDTCGVIEDPRHTAIRERIRFEAVMEDNEILHNISRRRLERIIELSCRIGDAEQACAQNYHRSKLYENRVNEALGFIAACLENMVSDFRPKSDFEELAKILAPEIFVPAEEKP